jgi:oxygen-independent coproporphyrinogen-3 oxidase
VAGIYIHIPFCNSFCSYCNFYSVKGKRYREQYVKAIKREIAEKKEYFKKLGVSPTTIYFGGGTPSVLSIDAVKEIFDTILKEFGFSPQEATIEVNPNDITLEYAKGLKEIGFNRISMGVQSFIDEHLLWMNRRHRSHEAIEAYYILRKVGFANISLDLIFGFSLLTTPLWEYNLSKIKFYLKLIKQFLIL